MVVAVFPPIVCTKVCAKGTAAVVPVEVDELPLAAVVFALTSD